MSCGPEACPPPPPSPESRFTATIPIPTACGIGTIFYNTPQTYVDTCPFGSPTPPITVTIPAYFYTSVISQDDADNQALTAAQTEAEVERALNPCATAPTGNFLTTEGGDFLTTEGGDFITT